MKIALGTVQFGQKYGLSNEAGKVYELEVNRILKLAANSDIRLLDTAVAYGESEKVLGNIGVKFFDLVTKLPAVDLIGSGDVSSIDGWVREHVERSLNNLNVKSLYGLLLHRPADLLDVEGDRLYETLLKLKEENIVKKIGVSVYAPEELEVLMRYFDFDIVQAPMNIIDRRLDTSGWINRLKKSNVEIHIRSVFLQGLLLMRGENCPSYFKPWNDILDRYYQWLDQEGLTALEACLGYVLQFQDIDRVVVGVDKEIQLKDILDAVTTRKVVIPPSNISSEDERLILPSKWIL